MSKHQLGPDSYRDGSNDRLRFSQSMHFISTFQPPSPESSRAAAYRELSAALSLVSCLLRPVSYLLSLIFISYLSPNSYRDHPNCHNVHPNCHNGHLNHHNGHLNHHNAHPFSHNGLPIAHNGHPSRHNAYPFWHNALLSVHNGHPSFHNRHPTRHNAHPNTHKPHGQLLPFQRSTPIVKTHFSLLNSKFLIASYNISNKPPVTGKTHRMRYTPT